MGHKAHPIGLRLGIHRKWNSNWFFESKNYPKFLHINLNIEKFIKGFLYFYSIRSLLLKCQIIKAATNQLYIVIFYYRLRKKWKKSLKHWRLKRWKNFIERYYENNKQNIITKNSFNLENLNWNKKPLYLDFNLKNTENFHLNKNYISNIFKLKNIILNKKKSNYLKLFKNLFFKNYLKKFNYNLNYNILTFFFKIKNKKIKLYYYKKIVNFLKKITFKKYALKKHYSFSKLFLKKFKNIKKVSTKATKKKKYILSKKNVFGSIKHIKKFLTKLTNCKIQILFINALSFTKFFYLIVDEENIYDNNPKFNVYQLHRMMVNKYKYHAIFIKDFVYLAFLTVLLKTTEPLVNFICEQFKRLPKNRKQFKLLNFITQTLKICCRQRNEFIGFKLQIYGRLNRQSRTHKFNVEQGILPIQSHKTRIEYSCEQGWTRKGAIGIHLWFLYHKSFKALFKEKMIKYLDYSKNKKNILKNFHLDGYYLELAKINKRWKGKDYFSEYGRKFAKKALDKKYNIQPEKITSPKLLPRHYFNFVKQEYRAKKLKQYNLSFRMKAKEFFKIAITRPQRRILVTPELLAVRYKDYEEGYKERQKIIEILQQRDEEERIKWENREKKFNQTFLKNKKSITQPSNINMENQKFSEKKPNKIKNYNSNKNTKNTTNSSSNTTTKKYYKTTNKNPNTNNNITKNSTNVATSFANKKTYTQNAKTKSKKV